jgi:hypothetical protein
MKTKLNISIYECTVHLWIVPTTKDVCLTAQKILKKHKINEKVEDAAWGYMIPAFNNYYILLSQSSLKDYNTFMHETIHCIDAILEDRNINDDEARAYLAGYIGNHFLKQLNIKYEKDNSNSRSH